VISLSGDGGLAMLMGELLTLAQYRLPVKIVLFNNHRLVHFQG
jgi:thiamine pyrophosphate-dependent acetolactate synthase large subunit-like protein